MFGRRRRALEQRVAELEERLDQRVWELPPVNVIPSEDLPTFPDYSVPSGWWADDEESWPTRCASPYGYL